jgi:tetratricopeptide (TPR) repeat protein
MKKLKVCVYAISKNEEKFVKRFVESVKEADAIYVLDTGSTDNTVKLLKENGVVCVEKEIKPWRFDVARNESLKLVPEDTDICVCIDLDEVLESGWREQLERLWQENQINCLKYLYHWSFDEYGNPAVTFHISKIHARKGFSWQHPVHEVLVSEEGVVVKEVVTNDVVVSHYPDPTKSRGSYLPLLEMSVEEDPEDDRNMHYLGREYMFYQKWDQAIETLHRHLLLKRATWKDERCASMRFMARCYAKKGYLEEARMWYEKAIKEAPYLRESYLELAFLEYEQQNYELGYAYTKKALEIHEKSNSYINEVFAWNYHVYDLLSILAFRLGYYDEAYEAIQKATSMNPKDERLQGNLKIMEQYITK